jgi:Tfp pilus assembly protein PilO
MKQLQLQKIKDKIYKDYLARYTKTLDKTTQQRFTVYLYVILSLLTVSFFGVFAIKPTLDTVSNLNKQYADNLLVYEALKNKLSALQSLDNQYVVIQKDLDHVYLAIPKKNDIPYMTRQLEELAKEKNVLITKLNFGTIELYPAKKPTPNLYSFAFTISVEGVEENVNGFITSIISFDRIVAIERIITGKVEVTKFGATISGKSYFSTQ